MLKTPFLLLLALAGCLLQSTVQAQQTLAQFPTCECADFKPTGRAVCSTFNIYFFDEAAMWCFNRCNKADLKVVHYGKCIGPVKPPPKPYPMSGPMSG